MADAAHMISRMMHVICTALIETKNRADPWLGVHVVELPGATSDVIFADVARIKVRFDIDLPSWFAHKYWRVSNEPCRLVWLSQYLRRRQLAQPALALTPISPAFVDLIRAHYCCLLDGARPVA